ncbi:hypothetical protein GCM10022206_89150 [Streptomyces chiangmaiensis]
MGEKSQRPPTLLAVSGLGARPTRIDDQSAKKVQESGSDGLGHVGWLLGEGHVDLPEAVRTRPPIGWGLRASAVWYRG